MEGGFASIEDMAAHYVEALRAEFPGPYILGGHSTGGVIAFAMARLLGSDVQALVMIDADFSEVPIGGQFGSLLFGALASGLMYDHCAQKAAAHRVAAKNAQAEPDGHPLMHSIKAKAWRVLSWVMPQGGSEGPVTKGFAEIADQSSVKMMALVKQHQELVYRYRVFGELTGADADKLPEDKLIDTPIVSLRARELQSRQANVNFRVGPQYGADDKHSWMQICRHGVTGWVNASHFTVLRYPAVRETAEHIVGGLKRFGV